MLNKDIIRFVDMQHSMGFKYRVPECLLNHYARFAKQRGDNVVKTKTVLDWAKLAPSVSQRRNRLLTVRRFAIAMQVENRKYEIPPESAFGLLPARQKLRYLFTDKDIRNLLLAASALTPHDSIRPKTYVTIFSLLAFAGLRSCEVLALNFDDVCRDGIVIKCTKFRKDRLVPLHHSGRRVLKSYIEQRDKCDSMEPALFISQSGERLSYSTLHSVFLKLMRDLGLRGTLGEPGLCMHDLRHSFAVRALERFAGTKHDVSRHMIALSTYLGHAHISDTYWYLQSTPKLLNSIVTSQQAYFNEG